MTKKKHNNLFKKAWKQQENEKLISSTPVSHQDLRDLFDHLDREAVNCDHTLRSTTAFLAQRKLDVERVTVWLGERCGYCDCEVLSNVEDQFGALVNQGTA